jgi:hypothetical protein
VLKTEKRDGRTERCSFGCLCRLLKLNSSTNAMKWTEITLNRNETVFDFLVFFIFFHTSSGTLLQDHVVLC